MQKQLLTIAESVLNLPTAPFREHAVREYIINFCKERDIAVTTDRMGNIISTYGPDYRNTVFAFAAHTDHPGFIIEKDSVRNRTTALFYGGVEKEYFKTAGLRVFTAAGQVAAAVTKVHFDIKNDIKRVHLRTDAAVRKGDIAMWDLPAYILKAGRIYSRCCDDGIGCVSMLAMLDELTRRKIKRKVIALFTVAEEAGLHGAKYLCLNRQIPTDTTVVSIETSSRLPGVRLGDGVVIRVGDKSSVFSQAVTAFMLDKAKNLKSKDRGFCFQRKLMDAGTCESSVYQAFGYTSGALCIPLGNYHNRNSKTKKIQPEFVSVSDLENMVKLLISVTIGSQDPKGYLRPARPKYRRQMRALGEQLFL